MTFISRPCMFPAYISCMSQSYANFLQNIPTCKINYFNNITLTYGSCAAIAYWNDKCNSNNYQQRGETPALLVMEHFRDSFCKPYPAKHPEPCFHWAWSTSLKSAMMLLSLSFQCITPPTIFQFFF